MKKIFYILFTFLLITTSFVFAQTKPKQKEKAPTQKEMEQMMKEAQQMMDEMDPEDKKMMDSMGIKMPSMKNVPKVSDKQLATAYENENSIVPKRDAARIASIPSAIGNDKLKSYISSTNAKAMAALNPSVKKIGDKFYAKLKSANNSSVYMGNAASGLWMMGHPDIAFYLMGKACEEDVTNTNNLSNYAAMLSMLGAQHLSIPLLNNLNTRFRNNSSLLNNLGQAWFGLGEIPKAEKYLDSAIRIYAYHPQANFTKCFIEESKGNIAGAVAVLKKSMKQGHTKEKEEKLKQLGQKPNPDDDNFPVPKKQDPLNLGGFRPPAFPKSVAECISLGMEWNDFRGQINSEIAQLQNQYQSAFEIALATQEKRMKADMAIVTSSINSGKPQGNLSSAPLYAERAGRKHNEMAALYSKKLPLLMNKAKAFFEGPGSVLEDNYAAKMEKLQEEDTEQSGEGKPNKDFCPQYREASDVFLKAYNGQVEVLFKEYMQLEKERINESAHWRMYIEWPEMFEATKMLDKINWLNIISAQPPITFKSITEYVCQPAPEPKKGKLAKFDDVACQYHSELKLPLGIMKFDCSRSYAKLDAGFLSIELEMDSDKKDLMDQFVSSTIEVGAKIDKDVELGPVNVGVSAGSRVGVEIDRTGIKDMFIKGGVEAGVKIGDLGPEAGIEGKISIISGKGAVSGTGLLEKQK